MVGTVVSTTPLPAVTRFYRAARAYAMCQITGTYVESLEDEYSAARDAVLKVHTVERVDRVEDLAYRRAMRDVRN